jgi:hypothetical protein
VEGKRKKAPSLVGCYSDDRLSAGARGSERRRARRPAQGFREQRFWSRIRPLLTEIKVALRRHATPDVVVAGSVAGAPVRAKAPIVRQCRLSHVLFTPDVDRSLAFYRTFTSACGSTVPTASPSCTHSRQRPHHIPRSRNRPVRCTTALGHERHRRHGSAPCT